jgi:hypothetical protein
MDVLAITLSRKTIKHGIGFVHQILSKSFQLDTNYFIRTDVHVIDKWKYASVFFFWGGGVVINSPSLRAA